jgi:hypothetical protein
MAEEAPTKGSNRRGPPHAKVLNPLITYSAHGIVSSWETRYDAAPAPTQIAGICKSYNPSRSSNSSLTRP